MILLLVGCFSGTDTPGDTSTDSADTSDTHSDVSDDTAPWVDPLGADDVHLLVMSTPGAGSETAALEELGADLSERWALPFDDGSGTAGALRDPDGTTIYARTWPPPTLGSALQAVDRDGALLWSEDRFFADISFVHGLVRTPAGDFVVADTTGGAVIAASPEGDTLWTLGFSADGRAWLPNGVALRTDDEGVSWLAVTLLWRAGGDSNDYVHVYRLGARDEAPTLAWSWPPDGTDSGGTWPHGPHFREDGTLSVALAARGQILGLDEGAQRFLVPPEPGPLAFPRDAAWLPDGSLVIADAATEVLRVADPLGDFEVVGAKAASGVYAVGVVGCGETACF